MVVFRQMYCAPDLNLEDLGLGNEYKQNLFLEPLSPEADDPKFLISKTINGNHAPIFRLAHHASLHLGQDRFYYLLLDYELPIDHYLHVLEAMKRVKMVDSSFYESVKNIHYNGIVRIGNLQSVANDEIALKLAQENLEAAQKELVKKTKQLDIAQEAERRLQQKLSNAELKIEMLDFDLQELQDQEEEEEEEEAPKRQAGISTWA